MPGTSSVFALLPPDNATGNFIHIVQRVPVRIALQNDEILEYPIRPGFSTVTSIHVQDSGLSPGDSLVEVSSREYTSDIFTDELAQADIEARKIIEDNLEKRSFRSHHSCLRLHFLFSQDNGWTSSS